MNDLMKQFSKVGMKSTNLEDSPVYKDRDLVDTGIPALNLALSGDIDGGLGSGVTVLAGPSKHFKSNTGLAAVAAYLRKYDDAICLFYDSEFGSPKSYWDNFGIDSTRVLHMPIVNIENLKFDLSQKLEAIENGQKIIIFVDSVGNLASKKEAQDAVDEKAVADMTRAREIKSLFRICTPLIKMKNLPAIFVAHTYQTMEMFSKAVVSGGTGIMYSSDTVIIFGRQQEKDGKDIIGYNFILNSEKSRFLREKSKIPLQVSYEGGIEKYSGMLAMALESGDVMKPMNGWYQMVDRETGEMIEPKVREKETYTDGFLGEIIKRKEFKEWVTSRYKLTSRKMTSEDLDDDEPSKPELLTEDSNENV